MEHQSASRADVLHVYPLTPQIRFRALFWAWLTVVAAGVVYPTSLFVAPPSTHALVRDQLCVAGLVLGATLYYLALTLAWVRHAKLVVSPQGVEHHTLGMTFYTSWSNVTAVRESRWEATLILAQPARSVYGKLFTYLPGARVRQLHNRMIPLSNYGWFHDSQLRQEVHHYVPHLLHTSG